MSGPDLEIGSIIADRQEGVPESSRRESLLEPQHLVQDEDRGTIEHEQDTASEQNASGGVKLKFREHATVWRLYLEEAEDKAKYKADQWNTGLDTLLIFVSESCSAVFTRLTSLGKAGTFAGVVSTFAIDARRDVQPNNEQNLLTGILDVLVNRSIVDIFGVPVTAHWVSALWTVSLFTTIFSAVMGVLAKAWLAKYTPAKTRRGARDAYRRYRLDWQAERWRLKEVLILVPLLVQIASVLFLVGLIIQLHGDSATIAWVLLSVFISGSAIYFFITISQLVDTSAPFNTPLSELYNAFSARKPKYGTAYKHDINQGLGDIFHNKLILSSKVDYIEEAIAEIARPPPDNKKNDEWIDTLCKNGTPQVVLGRFQQCTTLRAINAIEREKRLSNHLLAFLSFVEHYETKLEATSDKTEVHIYYKELRETLRNSLKPGYPLYRWNGVPDTFRPLLFALRTNVFTLLGCPHTEASEKTQTDFHRDELLDLPWEMTLKEIRSDHRIYFTTAACRGLVGGKENVRVVSSSILSLCLAKAAITNSGSGKTTEWAGNPSVTRVIRSQSRHTVRKERTFAHKRQTV
ncbi:hypothetical protein NMY22_g7693 [Coprinellus aureogranulatus]|nr:hypothetical protein NMY22_g7693 [Coprinellus aureogranulatus]